MKTTAESLDELQQKIDWEGGLVEYVCGYGGDMPEEMQDAVSAAKQAIRTLEEDFSILLKNYGVEPL